MNKKVLTALTVAGVATAAMATDVSADTYTVKSGDTLSSIAADHNTTVDRILNVNKIADSNMIFVGEQFELDDQAASHQLLRQHQVPLQHNNLLLLQSLQ